MAQDSGDDPKKSLIDRWMAEQRVGDETRIRYRHDAGRVCIDIRLHSWRQFFDSRDPSPFRDRDLDDDAVAYIVNSFLEINKSEKAKLVLHIAESRDASMPPEVFRDAIRAFFINERHLTLGKRRQMLRRARTTLVIGIAFLAFCITGAQWVAAKSIEVVGPFLREGLTITGWVAMWRPVDILLYEWLPLMDNLEVYGKLARLPVEVVYNA